MVGERQYHKTREKWEGAGRRKIGEKRVKSVENILRNDHVGVDGGGNRLV